MELCRTCETSELHSLTGEMVPLCQHQHCRVMGRILEAEIQNWRSTTVSPHVISALVAIEGRLPCAEPTLATTWDEVTSFAPIILSKTKGLQSRCM